MNQSPPRIYFSVHILYEQYEGNTGGVCEKYSITGKCIAAKFSEAEYRRHICKGDQLPKFDPLGSWRLAPTCVR